MLVFTISSNFVRAVWLLVEQPSRGLRHGVPRRSRGDNIIRQVERRLLLWQAPVVSQMHLETRYMNYRQCIARGLYICLVNYANKNDFPNNKSAYPIFSLANRVLILCKCSTCSTMRRCLQTVCFKCCYMFRARLNAGRL